MNKTIKFAVEESGIKLYEHDSVQDTWFTNQGEAQARIRFDRCVASKQMDSIRGSDLWKIDAIIPSQKGNSVDVNIIETLKED